MALALAEAGANLALVARDTQKLESVKAEIAAMGGAAEAFGADVTDEKAVQKLEKEVAAKLGKVQVLINNAGTNIRKHLVDFSLEEWHRCWIRT